jgi:hypothetical protein
VSTDFVGDRGEVLFRAAITKWCDGEPWFEVVFQGEKAEALDFQVRLRGSTVFQAIFYVQVKATAKTRRYSGPGKGRRLLVRLKQADAKKLGNMKIPAYVVGVDVLSDRLYLQHVPAGTVGGFTSMSTRSPLDCRAIRTLWEEVENFWNARPLGMQASAF